MTANLYDAHRQWAQRLPDERFESLEDLLDHAKSRKDMSREAERSIASLHVSTNDQGAVGLNGRSATALLTNWSFGQLCRSVSAPTRYLRSLPPDIVQSCLNHGLLTADGKCKILYRANGKPNGSDAAGVVAAITGPTYGRIWDAEVVEVLLDAISDSGWHLPVGAGNRPSGLYASDRDFFAFFVDDEDPVEVAGSKLGRGFFCWNSETGAASFGLTTFLYNHVCRNHVVWGAEDVREIRIEHRDQASEHFRSRALPALTRFVASHKVAENVRPVVEAAANFHVGTDLSKVLTWFENRPFTKSEIEQAWETGQKEGEDVTTLWGMVQGLTANARTLLFTNRRVHLERRAGALLKVAASAH